MQPAYPITGAPTRIVPVRLQVSLEYEIIIKLRYIICIAWTYVKAVMRLRCWKWSVDGLGGLHDFLGVPTSGDWICQLFLFRISVDSCNRSGTLKYLTVRKQLDYKSVNITAIMKVPATENQCIWNTQNVRFILCMDTAVFTECASGCGIFMRVSYYIQGHDKTDTCIVLSNMIFM